MEIIFRKAFKMESFLKRLIITSRTMVSAPRLNNVDKFINSRKSVKIDNLFSSHGFSKGQIHHILNSPNDIENYKVEDLMSNLNMWQTFGLDNKKLLITLTSNSELLTLNPDYITNRVSELMTLFTKNNIKKLMLTCPNLFVDDFEDVKERVEYIVNFMGVEQSSIVKTKALQFDFHYIQCRHNFMKRVGFYKIKRGSVLPKTPPLNKVFSRNVATFMQLSGLTEEEFTAFINAYKFEKELEKQYIEDSDEES